MEIEQYLYDLTATVDAIDAYTMRSKSGASVQLCNMGASVLALSLPDKEGKFEDIASGVSVRGINGLNGDFDNGVNFAERLWESSVETNRVMMMITYERDGVAITNQATFDFDDDNTLEITYIACIDQDSAFDLSQRMTFNLGEDMHVEIMGNGNGNIYPITAAQRGILTEVATLSSAISGRKITLLSSHPDIYYDEESITPVTAKYTILTADERFIQKCVYRFQ